MLREAIFYETNSGQKSSDAGALKDLDTAPEMTSPASKRLRGAEPSQRMW